MQIVSHLPDAKYCEVPQLHVLGNTRYSSCREHKINIFCGCMSHVCPCCTRVNIIFKCLELMFTNIFLLSKVQRLKRTITYIICLYFNLQETQIFLCTVVLLLKLTLYNVGKT